MSVLRRIVRGRGVVTTHSPHRYTSTSLRALAAAAVIAAFVGGGLAGGVAHASTLPNPLTLIRAHPGPAPQITAAKIAPAQIAPAQIAPAQTAASSTTATATSVVANGKANSLTEYSREASGNVAPVATISGPNTNLNGPVGVILDSSGDIFVANAFSIDKYAPGATGDVAPVASISGSNTNLDDPVGVALDTSGNLWVTNNHSNSITEYAKGASGNVKPMTTIAGLSTGLDSPFDLVIDRSGTLFVANTGANSVTEYTKGAHDNALPTATISGDRTQLNVFGGLALDPSGDLFVTNQSSITKYPKGANGNVAPTATISGPDTGLRGPFGADVEVEGNLLVSNFFNDSVTEYSPGADGDVAPFATISGPKTGLNGPSGIGATTGPTVLQPVAASAQFGVPNQTDEFSVASNGAVQVRWVQGAGRWQGPLDISPPNLASQGAHLAVSNQFGIPTQTDVFVVGDSGAISVMWVQGAGKWQGPMRITGANHAPAGADLAASNQFGLPNQTDVFVVANDGATKVSWVQGAGRWQGPLAITRTGLTAPGGGVAASNQFSLPNQTDVFVVANDGATRVSWVVGAGNWNGPLRITNTGLAPAGAHLAASNQFGLPSQTDVFVVANNGATQVSWVEGAGTWKGPLRITNTGLAPKGAHLAASNQFGIPNQTDVFVVANDGATRVSWVQGAGTWNGPKAISPAELGSPGAGLAASNQFGIPSQTDVFQVDPIGTNQVLWVQGAGLWQGPLAI